MLNIYCAPKRLCPILCSFNLFFHISIIIWFILIPALFHYLYFSSCLFFVCFVWFYCCCGSYRNWWFVFSIQTANTHRYFLWVYFVRLTKLYEIKLLLNLLLVIIEIKQEFSNGHSRGTKLAWLSSRCRRYQANSNLLDIENPTALQNSENSYALTYTLRPYNYWFICQAMCNCLASKMKNKW